MVKETELVKKLKAGDIQAFKQLFESYQNSIYNLCYRFVTNKEETEDLCQEVFLKIYKSINTFKHNSKLTTWIYRITINLCLNHQRKRKGLLWFSLNDSDDQIKDDDIKNLTIDQGEQPDSSLEKKEREKIVQLAVNSLPNKQRIALILQRYDGMSIKEIAEIMNCTTDSVQSRLSRAKKNLYKKLLPYLKKI